MGKNKRLRLDKAEAKKVPISKQAQQKISQAKQQSKGQPARADAVAPAKKHVQRQHEEPTIPFSASDRILLIGDGDLSFARSLVEHHNCTSVTASVLEKTRRELEEKYPQVAENIQILEDAGHSVVYNIDATKMGIWEAGVEGNGLKCAGSGKGRKGAVDRIIFNFPHVGGKSTDINRQVRYNQELLVKFFERALLSLVPKGSIIVTLFEGHPYTLWNIRDLARHSGLAVEKSFKFQSKAYPGYHHARTVGAIKNKQGELGGGWKGEERAARSFIFMRKAEETAQGAGSKRKIEESEEASKEDDAELYGSDEEPEILSGEAENEDD